MVSDSFNPASLRAGLAPLRLAAPPEPVGAEQRAYLSHYGLWLVDDFPGLTAHMGVVAAGGERVAAHCWQVAQPRGSVVVIHGYFDHVGLYRHLIRYLIGERFSVFAFDLPGHGLTTGQEASVESFDEYVAALDACLEEAFAHLPAPYHLMGQSTGGAVAMEWFLAHGHTRATSPFANTVLLAPLVRPYQWIFNRWVYRAVRPFINERPRTFANNSDDPEFLRFLRDDDPLQSRVLPVAWVTAMVRWKRRFLRYPPTDVAPLVIQGQQDKTVDWRYNMRVISRLFAARIVYLPTARHHLVNETEEIRKTIFEAIIEELA